MKKSLLSIAVLFCAAAITASAADAPAKKQMTPEQKALRTEMVKKYDTDSDKKLSKDEISKISEADQAKLKEAGIKLRGSPAKKAQ